MSFHDKNISDSRVICNLIDTIQPSSIYYAFLKNENNKENKMSNTMYAVSIARKMEARVFSLPKDIVEVKRKMVMTIFILHLQFKEINK